jgi:LAO/AO transport system kinase
MSAPLGSLLQAARQPGASGVRAASRLMSVLTDEPARLPELLQAAAMVLDGQGSPAVDSLADRLAPRLLLGVTGAPGSGKSTLCDALLVEHRRRYPDRRIGVVAVDPSSPFTGGAVLGDRVRMMRHATDANVFIRSMASRGHLGGLALGVKGVVRVMALIGCDLVLLETVGVGQSEVEVARVADLVAVVLAPGQGDSVQLLKAGLLEVADLLVVNKGDRPDASQLYSDVLAMLSLAAVAGRAVLPPDDDQPELGWARAAHQDEPPRVQLTTAQSGDGVPDLLAQLEELTAARREKWRERRRHALALEVRESVLEEARARLEERLRGEGPAEADLQRVLRGETSIPELAAALLGAPPRSE